MEQTDLIEQLYQTFGSYRLKGQIYYCSCGCISNEDEQKIYSKPLRQLTAEDLSLYSSKAMTTWGSAKDYKHFLPRIIELYYLNWFNGFIDIDVIYNKLKYANWHKWDVKEQSIIKLVLKSHWNQICNNQKSYISKFNIEEYAQFFEIKNLFKEWDVSDSSFGLSNFIFFFNENWTVPFQVKDSTLKECILKIVIDNDLKKKANQVLKENLENDERFKNELQDFIKTIEKYWKVKDIKSQSNEKS